jgi:hypothetical protein
MNSYYYRGLSKYVVGDKEGSCLDADGNDKAANA